MSCQGCEKWELLRVFFRVHLQLLQDHAPDGEGTGSSVQRELPVVRGWEWEGSCLDHCCGLSHEAAGTAKLKALNAHSHKLTNTHTWKHVTHFHPMPDSWPSMSTPQTPLIKTYLSPRGVSLRGWVYLCWSSFNFCRFFCCSCRSSAVFVYLLVF